MRRNRYSVLRDPVHGDVYLTDEEIERVDEMVVRWPRSGREQRFENFGANRIVAVKEGVDALEERVYPSYRFAAAPPEAPGELVRSEDRR